MRPERLTELLGAEFAAVEDSGEESGPIVFAAVHRNGCLAAIGMLQVMVTAADSRNRETSLLKGQHQFTAAQAGTAAHGPT